MSDPKDYVFHHLLKDGTPVTLRTACADDGDRIRWAFRNLEVETIYMRFFLCKTEISDAELKQVTEADFNQHVTLLVTIEQDDQEIIIGGASYIVADINASRRSGEVAFLVEEDYQGRGIASLLMQHLVRIGREVGLTRLEADVLPYNNAMLTVFKQSGLPITTQTQDGVVHVTLSLQIV